MTLANDFSVVSIANVSNDRKTTFQDIFVRR